MTTIPTFEPAFDAYEPSLETALSCAKLFAARLATPPGPRIAVMDPFAAALANLPTVRGNWLTLSGRNGCGKTMLARLLYAYARRVNPFGGSLWTQTDSNTSRRPGVVWLNEVDFVRRCKEGEYDLPEYLGEDWLVVMDDMGASRDKTGFAGDMLFRFCVARAERLTMFTTNFSAKQIAEQIDPRITSRLIRDGNQLINVTAGDYALRKQVA